MAKIDQRFLERAIELSRQGMQKGYGGPFGCVIVKDGEIVGEGSNEVILNNDLTAHGESVAIRNTSHTLKTFNFTIVQKTFYPKSFFIAGNKLACQLRRNINISPTCFFCLGSKSFDRSCKF